MAQITLKGNTIETVGDLPVVLEQFCVERLELLNKGALAFHVAMTGENEQFDLAAFLVRPRRKRPRTLLALANRSQIGVRVVDAVLQLPQCSVVIMQSNAAADFDTDVRRGDVLRLTVGIGDGFLAFADGIHTRSQIHAPDRLRAKLSNVELQVGGLEIAAPAGQEIRQVRSIV